MSLGTRLRSILDTGLFHSVRQWLIHRQDTESLLHPVYGWHQFDRGVSGRKLWRYYSIGRHWLPFFYGALGLLLFPLVFASFRGLNRTPFGFAVLFVGVLVLWDLLKRPITAVGRFWKTTGISHRPPEGMKNPVSPSSPTTVLGDHVAINGPLIGYDSTSQPHRIHARLPHSITERAPLAEIVRVEDGRTAVIYYYDMILGRGQYNVEPEDAIRRLAEAEIHELSHWACIDENHWNQGHSERWRDVIHDEFNYLGVGLHDPPPTEKESVDPLPE